MTSPLEALTTAALSAAMDGAMRRHTAIAANIANANTEGYMPRKVSFDAQVTQARAALREGRLLDAAAIESLRGEVETVAEAGAVPAVKIDAEMADLARNAVQFQALTQGLSRHLALQALAAADGRR